METRNWRRTLFPNDALGSVTDQDDASEKQKAKKRNVLSIEIGSYEIETQYHSPFPEEFKRVAKLHVCEFCLCYMEHRSTYVQHMKKCALRRPPGIEVYRDGSLSVFEVDGRGFKLYGQNLCLLLKLFLDHKTTFFDVSAFRFYVLCEVDKTGAHMVGAFSKEKATHEHVLACIMVFPNARRRGYGRLLISMAYELSRRLGFSGTPERPLTAEGAHSFRAYWRESVLLCLRAAVKQQKCVTINMISHETGLAVPDILQTLRDLGLMAFERSGVRVVPLTVKIVSDLSRGYSWAGAKDARRSAGAPAAVARGRGVAKRGKGRNLRARGAAKRHGAGRAVARSGDVEGAVDASLLVLPERDGKAAVT